MYIALSKICPLLFSHRTQGKQCTQIYSLRCRIRILSVIIKYVIVPICNIMGASYNLDTVGQGPTALTVGAGGGCLDIFTLIYPFSPFSLSLWETARYRLQYCLKGPLNLKPTKQNVTLC